MCGTLPCTLPLLAILSRSAPIFNMVHLSTYHKHEKVTSPLCSLRNQKQCAPGNKASQFSVLEFGLVHSDPEHLLSDLIEVIL